MNEGMPSTVTAGRGLSVPKIAERFGVGREKVRRWIDRGELRAVNVAEPGCKPRFQATVDAILEFERARSATTPAKSKRRRGRLPVVKDFLGGAA